MEFGSRAGSWTALAFFALMFGAGAWAVARAIRQRTPSGNPTLRRLFAVATFAGPLALVYATSLGGFYTATADGSHLRLKYLLPMASADVPWSEVLSVTSRPWYRGRWRLVVVTNDETRFESATASRDVVDRAAAAINERLAAARPRDIVAVHLTAKY